VDAWAELDEPIKAAMLAMVRATSKCSAALTSRTNSKSGSDKPVDRTIMPDIAHRATKQSIQPSTSEYRPMLAVNESDSNLAGSKKGGEYSQRIVDEARKLMERQEKRPTLDNARFADRYIEGEFHLLVCFFIAGTDGKLIASFQRARPAFVEQVERDVSDISHKFRDNHAGSPVGSKLPFELSSNVVAKIDAPNEGANRDNEAVFIDIVKFVEYPKLVSFPTLVRLHRIDSVDSVLTHSLYFSATSGFVLVGIGKNGKSDVLDSFSGRCFSVRREGKSHVVQRGPQALDGISGEQSDPIGDRVDARRAMDEISKLRVTLGEDSIRVGSAEGELFALNIADVLLGPFDL
jgi:hypothetical protein